MRKRRSARRPGRRGRFRAGQVSLKSPSGIAFSDFKGYEDWAVVSSARTDEVLKVIVANPTMINAYKAGIPATASLPGRLQDRETPMEAEEEYRGAIRRRCARRLHPGFVIEKDSKRFPKSGGWG